MKTLTQTIATPVVNQAHPSAGRLIKSLAALTLALLLAGLASAGQKEPLVMDPGLGQAVFESPEQAAQALTDALQAEDREQLKDIFGALSSDLVPMDPIDREDIEKYVALYTQHHALIPEGEQRFVLGIGEEGWTFPVPIVNGDHGWYFDTPAGVEQIRIRQIGRNELATIQAALAYYDAQLEYAEQDRNGDGTLEYAQRFLSKVGQHDGLYWETQPGEPLSPLGPLFADDGIPDDAYHGYHYRILKSQGPDAPGGAYDYVVGSRMIGGFALIAWPAEYDESGVMSFMVSHGGVVYESNLGADGASTATAMQEFNPGPGWAPVAVEEEQITQDGAASK